MSRMDKQIKAEARRKRGNEARWNKAKAPAGCGLAEVPRREGNGRESRAGLARDPHVETLKARCRRWGVPARDWRDMRDPWWGCEAGGAMAKATPRRDDRLKLWDAICHMRRVVTAFDRVMGAPNRHAQSLRLMLPIEEMHADATTPPMDERTDAEKEDDAVRALQWLEEWMGRAGVAAKAEAERVVLDDQRPADVAAMLSALHHISDGISGKRLTAIR